MAKLLKLLVVVVIAFAAWKYVIAPKVAAKTGDSSAAASSDNGCPAAAERASNAWGNGLKSYVNPPYDLNAWASFRSDIEGKISSAESSCSCQLDSCAKARMAMSDLRKLIADMDTAIHSGAPPSSDIVQKQQSIDEAIDMARELARQGK